MKKLLTILSAIGLTSVSISNIMAFSPIVNNSNNKLEKEDNNSSIVNLSAITEQNGTKYELKLNQHNFEQSQMINNSIQSVEETVFNSPTYNRVKRLYIDSSKDDSLPPISDAIDEKKSKAERDTDYYNQVDLMDINYLDYSNSKADFLKKFKMFKFDFDFGYNLWNSWKGWSISGGKSLTYYPFSEFINITGSDHYQTILWFNDPNHDTNEYVEFHVKEEWEGNHFRIKVRAMTKIYWASGSVVHHAAMAGFKHEKVTLYNNPGLIETVKRTLPIPTAFSGSINSSSSIKMGNFSTTVLKAAIKADMQVNNLKTAVLTGVLANFSGILTAPNGATGTSSITLTASAFTKLVTAMNLDLNEGIPCNFSLSMSHEIMGNMLIGHIYLKVNTVTYLIANSNPIPYIAGLEGSWTGAYTANYFGFKTS